MNSNLVCGGSWEKDIRVFDRMKRVDDAGGGDGGEIEVGTSM